MQQPLRYHYPGSKNSNHNGPRWCGRGSTTSYTFATWALFGKSSFHQLRCEFGKKTPQISAQMLMLIFKKIFKIRIKIHLWKHTYTLAFKWAFWINNTHHLCSGSPPFAKTPVQIGRLQMSLAYPNYVNPPLQDNACCHTAKINQEQPWEGDGELTLTIWPQNPKLVTWHGVHPHLGLDLPFICPDPDTRPSGVHPDILWPGIVVWWRPMWAVSCCSCVTAWRFLR